MSSLPCVVLSFITVLLTLVRVRGESSYYEEYLERNAKGQVDLVDIPLPGMTCKLDSSHTCPPDHCCVKEVISYLDLTKDMEVGTKCQPYRIQGELCLRQAEGYMCACARGLRCFFQNNETYGHCALINAEEEQQPDGR